MIIGDTETTGLLKPEANELINQPHIIEIYLVKLELDGEDFRLIDEFESYVKPPIPIDPIITKITGITDDHVAGAPTFAQLYQQLCEFFRGEDTFIAHNCAFDIGMLYVELARMEKQAMFPWPWKQICTVEESMAIENKRLKLKRLHEIATGSEHQDQHRARGDVEALATCVMWLHKNGYITL